MDRSQPSGCYSSSILLIGLQGDSGWQSGVQGSIMEGHQKATAQAASFCVVAVESTTDDVCGSHIVAISLVGMALR